MKKCKMCGNTRTLKRTVVGKVTYFVDYHPSARDYLAELTPVKELKIQKVKDVCICGSESFEEVSEAKSTIDRHIEANLWDLADSQKESL